MLSLSKCERDRPTFTVISSGAERKQSAVEKSVTSRSTQPSVNCGRHPHTRGWAGHGSHRPVRVDRAASPCGRGHEAQLRVRASHAGAVFQQSWSLPRTPIRGRNDGCGRLSAHTPARAEPVESRVKPSSLHRHFERSREICDISFNAKKRQMRPRFAHAQVGGSQLSLPCPSGQGSLSLRERPRSVASGESLPR